MLVSSCTSFVPIETQKLAGGSTILVYLSTTPEIGQLVTIRDTLGFLSSPQSITISTVGSYFTGGSNRIMLKQRYSYVTLRSVSHTEWSVIDQVVLQEPASNYSVKGLTTLGLQANQGTALAISTNRITGVSMTLQSTLEGAAPLAVSTIAIAQTPSTVAFQTGDSLLNTGNYTMLGNITTGAAAFSTFQTTGAAIIGSSVTIGGDVTHSTVGRFAIQGGISTAYATVFQGPISTGGLLQITSGRITGALDTSTIQTGGLIATTINTNNIQLSTAAYTQVRPDLVMTAPQYNGISTPVVEIQQGLAATSTVADWINASNLITNTMGIGNYISSPFLTSLTLSNAAIQNSRGSLVISSVQTGNLSYSNIYGPGGVQQLSKIGTGPLTTSTIGIQYQLITGQAQAPLTNADRMSSIQTTTSSLNLGGIELQATALTLSSIFISSGVDLVNLSSITIPNAVFNNTGGNYQAGSVQSATGTFSSITQLYYLGDGTSGVLAFSTPIVLTSTATASTISSYVILTSSVNAVSMQFGAPLLYSTISPGGFYLTPSTISGLMSNTSYEYVSGLGAVYQPLVIKASMNRTVNMIPGNISSFSTGYINAQFTYRSDGSTTSGVAGFRVASAKAYSTLVTFNANPAIPFQSFQLSNYPIDRNFDMVGFTYRFAGPSTKYPISDVGGQILVGAGNTMIYSYDNGATWSVTVDGTLFDTKATGVAWNGTLWIATGLGSVNTLAYSYDGIVWYGLGKSVFTFYANTVAWNGTLWAAGGAGTNTFAYSYDGITWTGLGSLVIGTDTTGIAWNGYMFIAVGRDDNTIAYSYDGIVWIGLGHSVFSYGHGVAWGGNIWVAVGEGTTIAYSYDGFNWSPGTVIFTTKGSCVAWSGSLWVAGGQGGYQAAYSLDGLLWTGVTIPSITNATAVAWTGTNWVLMGSNGVILTSSNGATWTPVANSPLSSGEGLATRSVLGGTGVLYTTTDSVTLVYSPGGKQWYNVTSLISGVANSIIWNGRTWLAAVTGGVDSLLHSTDGITWLGLGPLIFSGGAFEVAWNGYLWVSTGSGGNTLGYSYDGLSWTGLGATVFTTEGYGIAWGKDRFVATGQGTNTLAYSYDGMNWTPVVQSFFTSGRKLNYNGAQWVACGIGSSSLIYSSDGATWSAAPTQPFTIQAWDVAWGSTKWVAVGSATNGVNAASSTDGSTWTPLTLGISGKGVTWTGTKWVVTGGSNTNPIVYTSTDAVTWISESPSANGPAYTVFSKQSLPYERMTIACASSASALMAVSPDGRYWTPITAPFTQHARGVAWNGVQWVAGGAGTYQAAYSSDGIHWTGVVVANMTSIYAFAWGASADGTVKKWIAVGEGTNTRADSVDGINWTSYTPSPSTFFTSGAYAIIAAKSGWIALGGTNLGGLVTSTNGSTWTQTPVALFTTGRGIAWNGRDYVAVGAGTNTLAFSTDGTNWIGFPVFTVTGDAVAYGAGVWVAVGEGTSTIAYSVNGFEWTALGATVFSQRGKGISWNGEYFTAVGQGTNTIAYSDDGIHWTAQATTFTTDTYLGNSGGANGVGSRLVSSRAPLIIHEGQTFSWSAAGWAAAVTPSVIMKSPNSAFAWDSRVNSAESFTDSVYMLFRPTGTTGAFMMGVSEAPTTTTNFSQINYAFSCDETGALAIYESGAFVNSYATYQLGDTFKITYNSGTVQYFQNANLLRSIPRSSTAPLFLSCSIKSPGTKIIGIEFHSIYRILTTMSTMSTTSYVAATTPGVAASLSAPFYLTLNGDLNPSVWNIQFTAGGSGTVANYSTAISADIYINDTIYFSTNVINTYLSSPRTYQLNFSVPTTIAYTPNTALNVRFKADRTVGDVYSYVNWVNSNGTQGYSTVMNNIQPNPNAFEYLQFFHNSFNTGLQTSELATWLSPVSTNTTSYLDSNYSIEMNRSYIKWNTGLNAITIQNRFNDTQTRSLTYTGSLYNASDSNLKHSIDYAQVQSLAATFETIPLRRYTFSDAYCSTFQLEDRTQLGVITSEVVPHFVTETPFDHFGLSSLQTVDRTQLRFLHLATTQSLMLRISTLRGLIGT